LFNGDVVVSKHFIHELGTHEEEKWLERIFFFWGITVLLGWSICLNNFDFLQDNVSIKII
jgi:hypothetical protein